MLSSITKGRTAAASTSRGILAHTDACGLAGPEVIRRCRIESNHARVAGAPSRNAIGALCGACDVPPSLRGDSLHCAQSDVFPVAL